MAAAGNGLRRVVASPKPLSVVGLQPIRWLLSHNALVIAAGGDGNPVAKAADGPGLRGGDAVIDKDLCSSLLARELNVDCLVIATDVDAVYLDFGQPTQSPLRRVSPMALDARHFSRRLNGARDRSSLRVRAGHRTSGGDRLIGAD